MRKHKENTMWRWRPRLESRGQKPSDTWGHWELEEARKEDVSGSMAFPTSGLRNSETTSTAPSRSVVELG